MRLYAVLGDREAAQSALDRAAGAFPGDSEGATTVPCPECRAELTRPTHALWPPSLGSDLGIELGQLAFVPPEASGPQRLIATDSFDATAAAPDHLAEARRLGVAFIALPA